jgi:queuosine precursor transporter
VAGEHEHQPVRVEAATLGGRRLRYFDFVMVAFVTILLLSNVLGAGKVAVIDLPGIGEWPFGAGILFFPLSYVIGDVLTEVYGYARARRCIWAGTAALLFMAFMAMVVVALPPGPDRPLTNRCSGRSPGSSSRQYSLSGPVSSPTAWSSPR